MCLLVPGKVVKINGTTATIDYGEEERLAEVIDDNCKVGDYVLVQGKVVIDKVPQKEAEDALKLYREAVRK